MKKIKYLLLIVIAITINFGNVNAEEITSDEIENNSYVIGTHIYDGEVTLLTSHIMMAAKTISTNNLEDMIVYYKTPRGKWINGATGATVSVPKTFLIEYKNGELIKKIQYADVNEDGELNSVDVTLIRRYLAGYDILDDINLANADVNGDLKINDADVVLLRKYLVGNYPNAKLPNEPLGKTYIINYVIDNISSIDTYYTDYELEGEVLYDTQKPENPTKEGYSFEGWYLDENYTTKFEFGNTEITSNITLFAKFSELRYGDVNEDGELSISDVISLKNYLVGYEMLDDINLANADVNGDEKITEADVVLLRKYLVGNYPNAKLPDEPLGKTYYIKYVIDNISSIDTYYTDYELEGEVLYDTQKPENPTKEGYSFEGWYLDENYTTKFEFDNTKITSNLILFAKFVEKE